MGANKVKMASVWEEEREARKGMWLWELPVNKEKSVGEYRGKLDASLNSLHVPCCMDVIMLHCGPFA